MDAYGADVAEVVKTLKIEYAVLIGHSMGGPVILEAAKLLPGHVIGLIGVDTFNDVEKKYTPEKIDSYMVPFKEDFVKAMEDFAHKLFTQTADTNLVNKIVAKMVAAPPEAAMASFYGMVEMDVAKAIENE